MNQNRKITGKIFVGILVGLVLLILGHYVFDAVIKKTEAKVALREAKNTYIVMKNYDINEYAKGKCVYDKSNRYNLAKGLKDDVEKMLEHECFCTILDYDDKEHKITHFVYSYGKYLVEYSYTNNKDIWIVKYIDEILRY